MVIPLLIPFALFMAAVGVLAVHHSADMWMTPLLNRLARPHGNWLKRLAFAPLAAVAIALRSILQLVRSVLSHWAAVHLPPLTRWMHGLHTWANLIPTTALSIADDTLHALSVLRHQTIPRLIHAAVAPVRDLAREAERTAHRSISLIHAAERDFTRGIDRLIREHVLPRLRVVEHDVAVTIPAELGRVEARLKRLEKLIGLGVIGALVFRILAKVAPWIFCRNVKKVANTVCGLNPNELNTLLGLLAGAFAIADIRTLARLAESIEDEVVHEVRSLLNA